MSEHTHEHTHTYTHEHGSHHHNESHASELKRLAEKLKDQGYEAEAAKVSEACDAFSKGNVALREALTKLKEG